jgi:2-keto-4-pentenoate hydratase
VNVKLENLARTLARAWRDGTSVDVPAVDAAPRSRADAFAIQDRMAEILGDRCVGWKVAAAVPAFQLMEGYDGPYVGRLFADRIHTSPALLPAALFARHKIECEFAFRFKAGVPARRKPYIRPELEPLLVFHPGLEVTGHRYDSASARRKLTVYDIIADNGAGGGYVEGDGIENWRGIDFSALRIDARIDDGEPIQDFIGEYRRDPVDIVVETVNELSARAIDIAPGDLVSTGAVTLPTRMGPGQTFVARFGDLATLRLSFD